MPNDLHAVSATIPDGASIEEFTVADLPKNWRDYPAPTKLQEIGSRWFREQRSLILLVPSAVTPEEVNALLNPVHLEITTIADIQSRPFHFDPRMWK